MGAIASQITGVTIVYPTVYSSADQRKYQSSASIAFVKGIHRWAVNSPHKGSVTRKRFVCDYVIMEGRNNYPDALAFIDSVSPLCTRRQYSKRGKSMVIVWRNSACIRCLIMLDLVVMVVVVMIMAVVALARHSDSVVIAMTYMLPVSLLSRVWYPFI